MKKPATRDDVIASLTAFQAAQETFRLADAEHGQARAAGSATHSLRTRAGRESASEHLLTTAAEAEEALAGYRENEDRAYHKSIQDATVDSRRLHAQRLELEGQLANLAKEITVVEEREAPDVRKAVEAQQTASTFASMWESVVSDAVKLTQQAAA